MTRKYKLERLQKNILLGISGVTLASTMMFSNAQSLDLSSISTDTTSQTVVSLNKAEKAKTHSLKRISRSREES